MPSDSEDENIDDVEEDLVEEDPDQDVDDDLLNTVADDATEEGDDVRCTPLRCSLYTLTVVGLGLRRLG